MPRGQVFDTSFLIWHWQRSKQRARRPIESDDARPWARRLIDLRRTDAIVTPSYIEFVAGVRDTGELDLARSYLGEFRIIDGGRILPEDWVEARRLAERVPNDRKPRQLGDCLIRAIARRLKHEVLTLDRSFPR
jgi:predicted nucleic acid-binding protein